MDRSGLAFVVLTLCGLLLVGCAEKNTSMTPNLAPETYICLADSVRNPVVYIQKIWWWGEDIDGEVVGYEYRCILDTSETTCGFPEGWVYTTETRKEFHLPVTKGMSVHRIEVRAIDNQGAKDPTPAAVDLPLINSPPSVEIVERASLPDTTYPAIRLRWKGHDADGDQTIDRYLIKLDGSDRLISFDAGETTGSLGFDDFEGRFGLRTLYLYAIDTGCRSSQPATYTWYVKEPRGKVLLIDNLPKAYGGYSISDRFYRSALDSVFSEYSVLDFEKFGGAPYAFAYQKLFEMFNMVIWYNDPWYDAIAQREGLYLSEAAQGIVEYVSNGGRFILVSLCAIGTRGAFEDSIAMDLFGIDEIYWNKSVTDFSCKRWVVKANAQLGLEELKVDGLYQGADCFRPKASATPLFWIEPGTIGETQTVEYYIGVANSYGNGKAGLLTFPFSRSNAYGNLRKVFGALIDHLD